MTSVATPPPASQIWLRRWRRSRTSVLAAAALGGGVIWHGADRRPSDATQPLLFRGETAQTAKTETLRIGSFNIHGGRGPEGNADLAATAAVLDQAGVDLAGLFEVHGSFQTDQAEELGETLDMASIFAGTEQRWWHDHFGNGLLTRLPISQVVRIALPSTQGKRFRNALVAVTEVSGVPVKIVAAHLDTEIDRDRQLATVISLFRSLEAPAILMGDLNCTADHPLLAELLADPDVVDAVSEKVGPSSRLGRIDHLLTRGLAIVDAAVVPNDASDHPFVWAELTPMGAPKSSRTASLPSE